MKRLLLLFMTICVSIYSHAQATDLVVDCQTPGWLSSKINYGDQLTVQNLKVIGYINSTDMEFIGTLIRQRSLNGELDLSECNIVGNTPSEDDILTDLYLHYTNYNIRTYRVPKSTKQLKKCLYYLTVDSLFIDCKVKTVNYDDLNGTARYLYLADNIDSIAAGAFNEKGSIKEVRLSPNTRYIGSSAFTRTVPCNFKELDKLEVLGVKAFAYGRSMGVAGSYYQPDTIVVPQSLKDPFYLFAFCYRDGQHIFIGNNISTVNGAFGGDKGSTSAKLFFHIDNVIPPSITNYYWSSSNSNLSRSIVYVPKGAKEAYLNSDWKNSTIIELNPVESVTLNKHSIVLNKGEQQKLTASVLPNDADDKTIEWTSEDVSIATVDTYGNVTAIKDGQTKVIVKSTATGIQDECIVLVRKNVEGISLNEKEIVLNNVSETRQLNAIITPADATDKTVTWKSANEQICTVSDNGLVTATGIGSTLVTVTTVDGGLTATCVVKVLQHVDGVSLNKTSLNMKVGEGEYLQATVTPSNADNKKVTWLSSDNQIVTVSDEGYVAALKAGEATVTATSDDNSNAKATCKVIVTQPVTGIELAESTCLLHGIGESKQLTATVLPKDATNKSVKWSSSNEGVCIVSNGKVIATGYGIAVVIATTEDGGFSDNCTVTVESVTGIEDIDAEMRINATFYTPDGKVISKPQSGINIMRMSDGTMRKVMIK